MRFKVECLLKSLTRKVYIKKKPFHLLNVVTKEKEKNYVNLVKIFNSATIKRVFDKNMKGFIYELDAGVSSKIQFPKDEKQELALLQQYLVLQLFVPPQQSFSIEIMITDTSKIKRRINLTTAVNKIDINFFHVKVPIDQIKRGAWLNLAIDVYSFMELFKGQTFRSLDGFTITAVCKLRKIFTMKYPPFIFSEDSPEFYNAQEIPKNLNFPPGVSYQSQVLNYEMVRNVFENADLIKNSKANLHNINNNINLIKSPSKAQPQLHPDEILMIKNSRKGVESRSNLRQKENEEIKVERPEKFESQEKSEKYPKGEKFETDERQNFVPIGKASKPSIKSGITNPWIAKKKEQERGSKNEKENEYLEKTSKFNTLSDPRVQDLDKKNFNEINSWNQQENEIEENISIRNSLRNSQITSSPESLKPHTRDVATNFQVIKGEIKEEALEKIANSPSKNTDKTNDSQTLNDKYAENSKGSQPFNNYKGKLNNIKRNMGKESDANDHYSEAERSKELDDLKNKHLQTPYKDLELLQRAGQDEEEEKNNFSGQKDDDNGEGKHTQRNFYEEEINKMMDEYRPTSPSFHMKKEEQGKEEIGENVLEVVYDPVLNCYYDPKTNAYYDLVS